MDRPLLALTRPAARPSAGVTAETAAARNMRQLIQLRWLAVGGQALAVLVAHFGLGIVLPVEPMLATIGGLALVNLALFVALPRHRATDLELLLALLLDIGALTLLLYLSGGATNPFVSLYLVQVVLGAILLPLTMSWLLAVASGLAYAVLTLVHLPLVLPARLRAELDLFGDWLSFAMVAVLLVLFIARISRNLRARDAYLAEMERHAAEEDGIMRMGLFASNAAHELGTPLATMSVILSDWQRHPKLAGDAELAHDVADLRGEVQRCTGIVADILQSVGEARGESMQRQPVGELLQSVAADWRSANPSVSLRVETYETDRERVAVEPAVRQALWNLLDNAAFVSPDSVTLAASGGEDEVKLMVSDDGPGFTADQLAAVGLPYRSTKGAGHGLGLFLVATVARRLGGRLEARNREAGGAEVALVLPRAGPDAAPS